MSASRLQTALEAAGVAEGPFLVLNAQPSADMVQLPDAVFETTDAVARDQLAAQGRSLAQDHNRARVVIVNVARSKSYARSLIARAAQCAEQLVIVDGQKTDGVDALWRDVRARVACDAVTKTHGRSFWFALDGAAFHDWADPGMVDGPEGFKTQIGVFSDAKVDAGSALLAAALPQLKGAVADLGAGWGYLSKHVLDSPDVTALDLIETDRRALEAAQANLSDPRAVFHWQDALSWTTADALDAVVMNPPFHTSRRADPQLGIAFITAAARMLKPKGSLWMVANRHLPYEATLQDRFHTVKEHPGSPGFKLFEASRPLR